MREKYAQAQKRTSKNWMGKESEKMILGIDKVLELIKNKKISRSWIGIAIQPLLKFSENKKGILISGTIEGSPAEKAGFKSGDILLKVNGHEITVRFAEELPTFNQLIASLPIGKEFDAVILRDGTRLTLSRSYREKLNRLLWKEG